MVDAAHNVAVLAAGDVGAAEAAVKPSHSDGSGQAARECAARGGVEDGAKFAMGVSSENGVNCFLFVCFVFFLAI